MHSGIGGFISNLQASNQRTVSIERGEAGWDITSGDSADRAFVDKRNGRADIEV